MIGLSIWSTRSSSLGPTEAINPEVASIEQISLAGRLAPVCQAGKVPAPLCIAEKSDGHQTTLHARLDVQSVEPLEVGRRMRRLARGSSRQKRPRGAAWSHRAAP